MANEFVARNGIISQNSSQVTGSFSVSCNLTVGSGAVASAAGASVAGGLNNIASGLYSGVGSGCKNTASGNYSFIGAGGSNIASGNCATIAGGYLNTASVNLSTVGGGVGNNAAGIVSSIVGGCFNTISGGYSFIGGGTSNLLNTVGSYGVVGGGVCNRVSGSFSAILGGCCNTVSGSTSAILGGTLNTVTAVCSFAAGVSLTASVANTFYTNNSCICGIANAVTCVTSPTICGTTAVITPTACVTGLTTSCAVCVGTSGLLTGYTPSAGGSSPMTAGAGLCSIVGNCTGATNTATGPYSFTGGGSNNNNSALCNSSIVGGNSNYTNSNNIYSFVAGGASNNICGPSNFYGYSCYNTILTGCSNVINCNCFNYIGIGAGNQIASFNFSGCAWNFNTIVSGCNGNIQGAFGFIGNSAACALPYPSAPTNTLCGCTYGASIINGGCNTVYGFPAVPGTSVCFGTILGGCCNNVYCNAGLAFGQNVSSCNNFTTVIGCGLVGTSANTMYVNCMCVCGTLSKLAGSFRIPHPDPAKPTKDLIHSFVESPTAGENIYRYNVTTSGCAATIELPDYYKHLNCDDQVFVTPKNHFGAAYGIVNAEQTCVTFCSNCDGDYNVLIIGTRKDQYAMDYWKGAEVDAVVTPE